MAKISTYGPDGTLTNKDKVLGSSYIRTVNNVDEFETKNFTLEELNGFFSAEGSALTIGLKDNGGIVRETINNTTRLAVDLGASDITGQLANSDLANSSITINGTAISLGGTVTTPNTQLTDAQVRSKISVTGGGASYDSSTGVITLPSQFTLAQNNVTNASVSGQTLTLTRQSASDVTFTPTANDFTNTLKTKLDNIESNATADQTNTEIRDAVEAATDSNTFTDADHTKLDGIAAGAEVNVQANWNETTTTSDAFIQNKPTLFSGDYDDLTNKPTLLQLGTTSTTALAGNTSLLQLGTTSTTALAGNTTTITSAQASAITTNSGKTSFPGFGTTSSTALRGDTTTISSTQAANITTNNAKTSFPGFGTTSGTALEGDTSLFSGDYDDLSNKPTLLQLGTTSTTALAGNTTIPSGNQIIDWTIDQGSTNIHTGNYNNTQLTDAQVRSKISGTGLISYNSTTGVISTTANNYTLPLATSSARGGIKIGYTESGKNYPVELDSEKAYVNVPWTDTVYTLPTASSSTLGGVKVGGNLTIDGDGVLNVGAIALTTVQTAANQTAHLALTAQEGDIVVRSDENKSYVHNGGTAGTMADYTLLLTPTDAVLSVTTTDGTYINLTPNSATTGAITVTADLSAVNGTSDTTTRFLSQDNTWDVPSYTTETYTQHDNISAASSVDNSGRTYIQDITLDGNGHVTGLTSATETVTNTFRTVQADGTSIGSTETLNLIGGTNVTLSESNGAITIAATDTDTVYTHPSHPGDDINIDTGALTGATVISDLDINVETDLLGHVTDANATVATRDLTLADLGYTGATDANNYSLPLAASGTRGGVKIGYTENGKNYPVELSSEKMFVNVPWTDNNTQLSTEQVQDIVGAMVSSNTETNISVTYNDSAGKLNFSSTNTNILSGGTITGDVTVNGDMTFEDGHKLELGTGADLDLYHTSNNSYIDNNTGNLYIRCNPSGEIHLRPKESENGIIVRNDGKTELYFDNAKKLETVTGGVNVTGTMTASADVVAYSDERLKSDIKTLDGSKVYDMRGVSFIKDNKESSGVIAQELEKIAPELVNNEGEYKAVAYGNVVGYLIEAIKDLKAEIEILKNGSTK